MMKPIDERTLNPCPICGCSVRVWAKGFGEDTEYIIECDNDYCGLTYGLSYGYNRDEIEKGWNNVTAPITVNEDCINRQQAVEELETHLDEVDEVGDEFLDGEDSGIRMAIRIVKSLPPVTPTEKTGRWIAKRYCSECEWDKYEAELVCNIPTNYCPNCGVKMKGEE